MNINKEKITCAIAGVLFILGIVYTAMHWGTTENVVSINPPANKSVAYPIEIDEPLVLKPEYRESIAGNGTAVRENPFLAPSRRRPATIEDYPLPEPVFLPVAKNVPVPGTYTDPKIRPMLIQRTPPPEVSAGDRKPERGGDDNNPPRPVEIKKPAVNEEPEEKQPAGIPELNLPEKKEPEKETGPKSGNQSGGAGEEKGLSKEIMKLRGMSPEERKRILRELMKRSKQNEKKGGR